MKLHIRIRLLACFLAAIFAVGVGTGMQARATVAVGNGSGPGPAGPTGPAGAAGSPGPAGSPGAAGTFTPAPSATGQIPYSANGSTFSMLGIGTLNQCILALGSPLEPTWSSTCPLLGGTNTWTGFNSFTGQTATGLETICSSDPRCQLRFITKNGSGGTTVYEGPYNSGCNSGIGPNGGVSATVLGPNSQGLTQNVFLAQGVTFNGNSGVGSCVPFFNTAGIYSDATASSDGVVKAWPWHPGTAPTCTVGAGGTTCNTTISPPQTSMVCSANERGTGALFTGEASFVQVGAPGASVQLTWISTVAWTAGGTVTFNVTCD